MAKDEGVIARDGLVARNNGAWARDKLSFLDEFVPPALLATQRKQQRWYVDLFAGPGKNVDGSGSGEEFDGSALRALTAVAPTNPRAHFTHAILVNLAKADNDALTERVNTLATEGALRVPRRSVQLLNGDANQVIHRVMKSIGKQAYTFVIADIEAPKQLKWDTVKALKEHGHKSVDLFVLFPLDMALNRMLSYRSATVEQSATVLNSFFGCEDWRPLLKGRITNAQSPALRRAVLDLYMSRLRSLRWAHVMVVRNVKRAGESGLYKMIYASNHPAGKGIAEWSAGQPKKKGQLDMFR